MPYSPIPPNLSTSQYQQLVLELLNTIGGPGSLDIQPPILSTADYRHLVLYALNYIATNGAGAKTFVELEDTPNSYAGAAGYVVQVKGDESGLEFILGGGGGSPSGPAGGDLAGSYPNPTIAPGVIPTSLPPNGAAGGDLAGTYPNPTIKSSVDLTGIPTAPTAAATTNTTQIASTAFVQSAIDVGTAENARDLIAEVVNADSVPLPRGTVVYAFGSTGNKLSVKRADNSGDATSATTLGFIRDASLAVGAQGTVTVYGSMDQLDLGSPFVDGDSIYLGTSGGYTKTKPVAPAHNVFLGIVERANAGNGIAYVKVQNGYELDELHDVLITSEAAGQALVRNAANTLWINKTLGISDITSLQTELDNKAPAKGNFLATITGTSGLFNTNNITEYVMPWNTVNQNTDTGVFSSPGSNNILITPVITTGAGEWYYFEARYTSYDITDPNSFMRLRLRSDSSLITTANGGTLQSVLSQRFTHTTSSGEASVWGNYVMNITAPTYFAFTFFHTSAPVTGYPVFNNNDGLQPYIYIRRLGV